MTSAPQGLALQAPANTTAPGQPWRCTRCDHRAVGERPLGCSLCGRVNSFARASAEREGAARSAALSWAWASDARAEDVPRAVSSIAGFDRVLGGGLVRRRVTMLGGIRGLGKSTLALLAASGIASSNGPVLFAPLEQGVPAARRMLDEQGASTRGIAFTERAECDELAALARELGAVAVFVDSWKMLTINGQAARSGTLAERASMAVLMNAAAADGFAVLGILHMRTGDPKRYAAGAPVLQLCDVLLRLDRADVGARLICDAKNRYGSALERAEFRRDGARLLEVLP